MKRDIIALNMNNMIRQNIIWSILLVIVLPMLNYILQPRELFLGVGNFLIDILLLCAVYVILIVLHELFHLVGFVVYGNVPIKSLKYGLNLELGIAYATTSTPLENRAMKKALLLPFWLTGVVPTIFGFYTDNYIWIFAGALLIAGAVGDFAMYKALQKFPKDALVQDDPKEPTLYVYPPGTTEFEPLHEQEQQ